MTNIVWEAMRFAIDQYEKAGTCKAGDYSFPPAEMFSLLNSMNMGFIQPNVLAAGVLFNTIEDTASTLSMIRERFGDETTGLVAGLLKYLFFLQEEGPRKQKGDLSDAVVVNRRYAERIEDNWREEYDYQKKASGICFEDYFVAVKEHLRGFLKEASDSDLDMLVITNLEYIRTRYETDLARLVNGETTTDLFLTESPAMTADELEQVIRAPKHTDGK